MTEVELLDWPYARASLVTWHALSAFDTAVWECSRRTLSNIRAVLDGADLPTYVLTLGICGGLGRMEQTPFSDGDIIVVVSDDASSEDCRAVNQLIGGLLRDVGLAEAKAEGIYATAVYASKLFDSSTLGQVTEDMQAFGCRMQLLLESQPVWRNDAFEKLLSQILDRYQSLTVVERSLPRQYLLHDLVRYYRSLSIRYHAADLDDPPRWRLLNLKFRHSRRMSYLGLIAIASRDEAGFWGGLRMTPVERLLSITRDDARADRIDVHYSSVLRMLCDEKLREQLVAEEGDERFASHETYAAIRERLSQLESELSAVLLELFRDDQRFLADVLL